MEKEPRHAIGILPVIFSFFFFSFSLEYNGVDRSYAGKWRPSLKPTLILAFSELSRRYGFWRQSRWTIRNTTMTVLARGHGNLFAFIWITQLRATVEERSLNVARNKGARTGERNAPGEERTRIATACMMTRATLRRYGFLAQARAPTPGAARPPRSTSGRSEKSSQWSVPG